MVIKKLCCKHGLIHKSKSVEKCDKGEKAGLYYMQYVSYTVKHKTQSALKCDA